jgi:hypothetical protein
MTDDVNIRGARALQLLEDEVLQEAITGMVEDAWAVALRADLRNPANCIAAIATVQATDRFKDQLKEYVTAGKAAERKPYKVA